MDTMLEFEFSDFDLLPAIAEALDAAGVDGGVVPPGGHAPDPGP